MLKNSTFRGGQYAETSIAMGIHIWDRADRSACPFNNRGRCVHPASIPENKRHAQTGRTAGTRRSLPGR